MAIAPKTFAIGDLVRMIIPVGYIPADHSKDVSGIVGRVTNIHKHFEYESSWLYEVTFSQYYEYRVFDHAVPANLIQEELICAFWNEQLELVDGRK